MIRDAARRGRVFLLSSPHTIRFSLESTPDSSEPWALALHTTLTAQANEFSLFLVASLTEMIRANFFGSWGRSRYRRSGVGLGEGRGSDSQ